MTWKHQLGKIILPLVPLNRKTVNIIRFELGAAQTRILNRISPSRKRAISDLRSEQDLMINVGSGGEGYSEWVNIDVRRHHKDQDVAWDIRHSLPFSEGQAACIFAEHVVEHLEFRTDVPVFFKEAHRVLKRGGVFRIVVPDARRWCEAYLSNSEVKWQALGFENGLPCDMPTDIIMLNHVFHQGGEHQFGWDFETMNHVLREAGFSSVEQCAFGESQNERYAIDLPHHKPYSLYVEATKG